MTKFHKKLLVFLSVLVCTLCLCLGLAACNPSNDDNTNEDDGHTHAFAGAWLYDGAEGHYQLATCHPTVKSALEAHVDESEDGKCDVCDYPMTSEDDEHQHTYKEEWSFNEKKHWHDASCEHFIERSDYDDHDFVEGVCECGVKESEVKVYDLYRNSPEYDLEFVDWLEWLKEHNVESVEYTASGDGIYHYKDGTSEVRFLGERTAKVSATADGEPLADVWFMISMYYTKENKYYESNGTIALGIAKTGANGIAEITFRPAGGYSSETVEYRIRVAEAKDIAKAEKIDEESVRPIPNRYVVKGGNAGFEFEPYEVSENANSGDIDVTLEFTYSKGWNAYYKLYLPYRRYWQDQVNGTDIQEIGTAYHFTSSGENLFDYFYFSPQLYDYKQGGTIDKNLQIVENAKIASSGVYKISYTVDRNANAELYFWDEDGVNLDTSHQIKADGTPADTYLTQKVEGQSSFVTIKISPALGLRLYQLGIKTDIECNVNITVERLSDFGVGVDYTFEWDNEAQNSQLNITIGQEATLKFGLNEVPEGLYVLTLPATQSGTSDVGRYYAWTDDDEQKFFFGEPKYWGDVKPSNKAIIKITEDTNFIFLQNNGNAAKQIDITLEKYELPTVTNEFAAVPVTPAAYGNSYTLPLSVSVGTYNLSVWISSAVNGGADKPLSVYIGDNQNQLTEPDVYNAGINLFYTYSATVEIGESDNTISIRCSTEYSIFAGVKLTIPHECKDVCPECNKCLTECKEPECKDKCAGHDEPEEPEDGIIADLGELTLSAGEESSIIYLNNLQSKKYYLIAETDGVPASGVITILLRSSSGGFNISGDMFAPVANAYKFVFDVQEKILYDWNNEPTVCIKIKNSSEEELHITKLQVVAYEEFTIQDGQEFEITVASGGSGFWYMPIDESLAGKKVRITVTNFTGTKDLRVYYNNGTKDTQLGALTSANSFVGEMTIPEGITALAFVNMNSSTGLALQNVTIKIEIID